MYPSPSVCDHKHVRASLSLIMTKQQRNLLGRIQYTKTLHQTQRFWTPSRGPRKTLPGPQVLGSKMPLKCKGMYDSNQIHGGQGLTARNVSWTPRLVPQATLPRPQDPTPKRSFQGVAQILVRTVYGDGCGNNKVDMDTNVSAPRCKKSIATSNDVSSVHVSINMQLL